MSKFLSVVVCMLFFATVLSVAGTEIMDESPAMGEIHQSEIQPIDMWDLQISFDLEAASGDLGNAGAEFDGTYFYSTRWASNLIHQYDIDGILVKEFSIPGVNGLRDLAYDGEYFYGGAAGGTIWQMDFDSETLVDTISGGFQSRAIAYNDDDDVFICSNWGDPAWVVDRTGAIVDTINLATTVSTYGMAYDSESPDGPFLWVFDQGDGIIQYVHQWDLAAGAYTGVQYDVALDFPTTAGIAGGLFLTTEFEEGIISLGGLLQGVPDMMFCYELGEAGGGEEPELEIGEIAGGLGLSAAISNTGDADATDVEYTITVTGGILGLINVSVSDVISTIPFGDSAEIASGIFFGLGAIDITITAMAAEGADAEAVATGTQIIIFTMV